MLLLEQVINLIVRNSKLDSWCDVKRKLLACLIKSTQPLISILGLGPMKISPAYCASKHGAVGFTRSLKDCPKSDGVRVNALCPEYVDTKMVRDGLEAENDEKFKAFVLSKMTRY